MRVCRKSKHCTNIADSIFFILAVDMTNFNDKFHDRVPFLDYSLNYLMYIVPSSQLMNANKSFNRLLNI